jgi:hypothetical protein
MVTIISIFMLSLPSHQWEVHFLLNNKKKIEFVEATTQKVAYNKIEDKYRNEERPIKILAAKVVEKVQPICWEVEFKLKDEKKREVIELELRSECAIFLREKYKGDSVEIIRYNKILSNGNLKPYMPAKYVRFSARKNAAPAKVAILVPKHQSGCDFLIKYELLGQEKEIIFWAEDENDARAMLKKKINLANNFFVIKSCVPVR